MLLQHVPFAVCSQLVRMRQQSPLSHAVQRAAPLVESRTPFLQQPTANVWSAGPRCYSRSERFSGHDILASPAFIRGALPQTRLRSSQNTFPFVILWRNLKCRSCASVHTVPPMLCCVRTAFTVASSAVRLSFCGAPTWNVPKMDPTKSCSCTTRMSITGTRRAKWPVYLKTSPPWNYASTST